MSSCSQVEECLEAAEERAWRHLFFLPDSPGDNIGYICSYGCAMLTSDDFLKSGITSEQSGEILNKAKAFKNFSVTWNKSWSILLIGL